MNTILTSHECSIRVFFLSVVALAAMCSAAFGQDPLQKICDELENTEEVKTETTVARPAIDIAELHWKRKKKFAIVISAYKSADSKSDLPFAEVDGNLIARRLCALGYTVLDVLTDSKATRNNIQSALEQAQKITRPENGLLLVYYSGHGVVDEKKEDLWLQVFDQTPGDRHGIKLPEVIANAYPAKARGEMAIMVDSCFSGKGTFSSTLTPAELRNIIILSSGSGDEERSYSITTGKDAFGKDITASAFSYYFSEALPKDWDKVDVDRDGIITYGELRSYTARKLACAFRDKKIPALMKPSGLPPNSDEIFAFDPLKARVFKSKIRDDLAVMEFERLAALESQGLDGTEQLSFDDPPDCKGLENTPEPGPSTLPAATPLATPESSATPVSAPSTAPSPLPFSTPIPSPSISGENVSIVTALPPIAVQIKTAPAGIGEQPIGFLSVEPFAGNLLRTNKVVDYRLTASDPPFYDFRGIGFQQHDQTTVQKPLQEAESPKQEAESTKRISSANLVSQLPDVGDYAAGLKATALGNYDEARSRLEKVWQQGEFDRARVARALGRNEIFAGQYGLAANWYREVLKLNPEERNPEILNEVGSALRLTGDYDDAERLFQRAIAELKKYSTDLANDRTYIVSVSNLARMYDDEEKYKNAEPLYQTLLTWNEARFGQKSRPVALILNNLAGVYYNQGEFTSALSFSERSLTSMQDYVSKMAEEDVSPNMDGLAMILVNQAAIYRALGDLEKPEILLTEAIRIDRTRFGEDHPQSAEAFLGLAILRLKQGRPKESESLFTKVIMIQEKTLGAAHPDLAFTLEQYAVLLSRIGREEEATKVREQAKQIKKATISNRSGNSGFFKKAIDWMDTINPIRLRTVLTR